MAKRGRPALENPSHSCHVRVPHKVYVKLMEYCERSKKSVSQVLVEAAKDYIGVE